MEAKELISSVLEDAEYISHYGVKGMKWGKRKKKDDEELPEGGAAGEEELTEDEKKSLDKIKDPKSRAAAEEFLRDQKKKRNAEEAKKSTLQKTVEKAGQDFSKWLRDKGILSTDSTTTSRRTINGKTYVTSETTRTTKGKTTVVKPKKTVEIKKDSGDKVLSRKKNKDGSITTVTKTKNGTSTSTQKVTSITGADGTKYDPVTKKPLKSKKPVESKKAPSDKIISTKKNKDGSTTTVRKTKNGTSTSTEKITSITGADGTKYDPVTKKPLKSKKKLKHADPENDLYLAHYGVLGMKWGVRKDRGRRVEKFGPDNKEGDYIKGRKGARTTIESIRKADGNIETTLRVREPRGSTSRKSSSSNSARRFSDLSDEELKTRILRIENEQKLARLLTPPPKQGREFVRNIVKNAGSQILTTAAVGVGTYALNSAVKKFGNEGLQDVMIKKSKK